jgi:phosphohistidine phosphatase SixA
MIPRRALALLPLATPFATPIVRAQGFAFLDTQAAIALLRAGGLNLYIRHAITDRRQVDTGRRGDRAGQRNLSAAGEEQAVRLGGAFAALQIPVAEVLTSEVFRALETAQLAFGPARVRVERDLIADDYTPGDPFADARAVSRRLAEPVQGGNRVMVGHIVPLGFVLGRGLAQEEFPEGAMGVFRPTGPIGHGGTPGRESARGEGARWEHLGFLRAEQLIMAARLP